MKNQERGVCVYFWVEVVKCWEIFPDSILLILGAPCEQDEFTRFPESGFQDHLGGKPSNQEHPQWIGPEIGELGDLGSVPGLGRSPGKENGYPLQYSGLENSMDRIVHGVKRDGHD